eukprot:m.319395 g.319395  ORF g.319395 m.319395 type:complete len:108 (-) comp23143_c0_seq1:105-428(-)
MPEPRRLYSKAKVLGYRRNPYVQNPNHSLLRVEGVNTRADTDFYMGKRVAYVYRAERKINDSKVRVIWGRIVHAHGNGGVVRATFRKNLPPKSFGATVRVMLYPSRV